jgi:hypothetical protein
MEKRRVSDVKRNFIKRIPQIQLRYLIPVLVCKSGISFGEMDIEPGT